MTTDSDLPYGQLYIVPTPIGNLEDITLRALRILKEVDLILCEDTRQTSKLLQHYEIKNKLASFHMHNEHKVFPKFIDMLLEGKRIALVSDAGTPGISDPGFLLARECQKQNIFFSCLPGATALIPALVQSGFPSDRFRFEGFLPPKKGRKTRLESILNDKKTTILYVSPHKILKTLNEIKNVSETFMVSISREISKIHEETITGTVAEVIQILEQKPKIKGEIVLVINNN
jgi:16S rRNA (cytidine1402-2'-O)-methyltransferase